MSKPGRGRAIAIAIARARARARATETFPVGSSAQAKGAPSIAESKTEQEMEPNEKLANEQERKMEDKEKPNVSSQAATPPKAKLYAGQKSEVQIKKPTCDELTENVAAKGAMQGEKQDVTTIESGTGDGSDQFENLSPKTTCTTDVAFMTCSPSDSGVIRPSFRLPEDSTEYADDEGNSEKIIREQLEKCVLNEDYRGYELEYNVAVPLPNLPYSEEYYKQEPSLDLNSSKEHEELSSDNEKTHESIFGANASMPIPQYSAGSNKELNLELANQFYADNEKIGSEIKSSVDECMFISLYSEESDKQELNLDLNTSKEQEELSADNEKMGTETKSSADECMFISQDSEESYKQELNLDLNASKEQEELSADNEKMGTETKSSVDECMFISQDSEESYKQELNLDLNTSKEQDELSADNEKMGTETKSSADECMFISLYSEESDKQELNLDLNASKVQEELSSDNEKENETKSGLIYKPVLQHSEGSNKQELNLDPKSSEENLESSSDTEKERSRSKTDEKELSVTVPSSKDVDWRKLNINQETLNVQQILTDDTSKVDDETTSSLHDFSKAVKEAFQVFNLNDSNAEQEVSSEKQNELSGTEMEEIINMTKELKLRFEFDAFGNKKLLLNDKKECIVDKKKKITFNIGDENVKLSIHDNKISIFADRGEVTCSMRLKGAVFFIEASTTKPESSTEGANTNEQSRNISIEVVDDPDIPSVTDITKPDTLDPSVETPDECGAEKFEISTLKADSSLAPCSEVQERLRNRSDTFLSNLRALCNDYECDFLECLNKKIEDSPSE